MIAIPRLFWGSLRWRLTVIVVLALIPFLAFLVYEASRDRYHEAGEIERDASQLVQLASQEHQKAVEGGRRVLAMLAQQHEVYEGDAATCSSYLARILPQFPSYTMMGVAGLDGSVPCSGLPLTAPLNVADRLYFQRVWATKDFVVGDYIVGRASGKTTLPLAYPVASASGRVERVLFLGLDANWIGDFATEARLQPGLQLSIVDRAGTVRGHFPEPVTWAGKSLADSDLYRVAMSQGAKGTAHIRDPDGVDRFYAFTPLYGAQREPVAFLSLGLPSAEAFAEVNRRLWLRLLGIGLMAAVALLAALWAAEGLVARQARALARAAQRLAAGDLQARTGLLHEQGEMGQLARSFDDMAHSLQARQEAFRAEHAFRVAVEDSLLAGVLATDLEGRQIYANPAFCRMVGWSQQELLGTIPPVSTGLPRSGSTHRRP